MCIQSDRVGNIFKFNCSSGKCSVTLEDLPPELNSLAFMKNYSACIPAA